MSKYKRLTSDTGFARNLPISEELYDRLYELENAIENGTLVELPCKCIEELDIIKGGMIFIFL